MALKLISKSVRVNAAVNDRIAIRYLAARGTELVRILLKHLTVVEGVSEAEQVNPEGSEVEREIYLNRPDSQDEGVLNKYTADVIALQIELEEIRLSLRLL